MTNSNKFIYCSTVNSFLATRTKSEFNEHETLSSKGFQQNF
ncbi:hypothetical protein PAUR_a2435 [Pseudoalteromonas aurantia 208]|uniref:Orphan protein n=1 Tax=Pseudoalteromonas aurantia 208 TaxID=1314867 RepID=A0ABR9ECP1_9GAMM|nr:hypothetical protein [Pseudoalteromonas aurantia 208]MBE0367608.1 hypothetical protein [Pseudoalteromonas aurantia 208]MBE0368751.1 hypothetical protein [Pseudoalteromonas aurantia 208]